MVGDKTTSLKRTFAKRFASFLSVKSAVRNGLLGVVDTARKERLEGFVFGGAVRDVIFSGPKSFPRDVDIVFTDQSFARFSDRFHDQVIHRNRFGGLYLRVGWVDFDVWPLGNTWAFKNVPGFIPSFESLPQTTFLSIDAIVVELWAKPGSKRRIYEQGFFKSLETKTIDLNLEENPFPALCILRSLVMSQRLQFRLTERLADYIVRNFHKVGMEGLIEANQKHYERPVISFDLLGQLFSGSMKSAAAFNSQWLRINDGLKHQGTFDSMWTEAIKERHSSEEQLSLSGLLG